jgi:hypothetical protein
VRIYGADNVAAQYRDVKAKSTGAIAPGTRVQLAFIRGDPAAPVVLGELSGLTISEIHTDAGRVYKDVPYLSHVAAIAVDDKILLFFLDGDSNKPIAIQNVDLTQLLMIQDEAKQDSEAYAAKNQVISSTDQVVIIHPSGTSSHGVAVKVAG